MFLFLYPILLLGIYNHKFGYPKKGTWYEPTGILYPILGPSAFLGNGTWRALAQAMDRRADRGVRVRCPARLYAQTIPFPNLKAQNGPKALYNVFVGPKDHKR